MDTQSNLFKNHFEFLYQVAEIEVSYKTKVKSIDRPQILTSQTAYDILLTLWNEDHIEYREEFKVLLMNLSSRVLGIVHISQGGVGSTTVDAKLIFGVALKANASRIILVHNHPSGNLTPSEQDKRLTTKLKQAGEFLDIKVMDHIILTPEGYYSFADQGLL